MATQRYVSTSFWDDGWIQTLDPSEKLLYLYLMTNPLTNIAGVYKITDRRISFDTGFNLDTIRHIFRKFEKAGKAYRKDEYVVIPSWPKHQKWEKSSKVNEGIIRILKELDVEILKYLVQVGYRYPIDTLSIPNVYPPNYSYSDLDLDLDSDLDLKKSSESDDSQSPTMEQASELAHLLQHLHQKQDPKYSGKPNSWKHDIEKLIRIDGRDPDEVRSVIVWTKSPDNFWFPNIMSGKKLREKYPTLKAQMERDRELKRPKYKTTEGYKYDFKEDNYAEA